MALFNLVSAATVTIGVAALSAALVVVGLVSAALLLTRNASGRPSGGGSVSVPTCGSPGW